MPSPYFVSVLGIFAEFISTRVISIFNSLSLFIFLFLSLILFLVLFFLHRLSTPLGSHFLLHASDLVVYGAACRAGLRVVKNTDT